MGMTPDQFFEAFVEQNRWDCHENPGDIRRAFNAAVSASHLADHYFTFNKRHNPALVNQFKTIGAFIEHLSSKTNGGFRDIRSISNAYKHLYTDTGAQYETHSSVNSSGSIDAIKLLDDHIDGMKEEFIEKTGDETVGLSVVFTRKDGSRVQFLPVLDSVVDYFTSIVFERE